MVISISITHIIGTRARIRWPPTDISRMHEVIEGKIARILEMTARICDIDARIGRMSAAIPEMTAGISLVRALMSEKAEPIITYGHAYPAHGPSRHAK